MGKVLSGMFKGERGPLLGIFLDFENAKPNSAEEIRIHGEIHEYLKNAEEILTEIANFQGCDEVIRKAITTPSPANDKAAWDAIVPSVDTLKKFYDFSVDLEEVLPKLLMNLFSNNQAIQTLKGQQALAKQLADILDFVLRFDDAKMINPAIQNDFSYYRRSLSKQKNKVDNIKIKDELANKMSLFFAYPTPMLKVIHDTTLHLVKTGSIGKEDVVSGFSLLANVCLEMVEHGTFTNNQTNMFCLRAMTASIVLVDHIDEQGAFCKKTGIHVKSAIVQLNKFAATSSCSTDCLLNALRFSTVHLNDPQTPEIVKKMLS